jgi:hypothetical protein
MPSDANLALQASVTKVATFSSTALTLPAGTPRGRALDVRVIYSAATNASGSNGVLFSVDVSKDNGSTFNQEFLADPIALSTTAQASEIFIPISLTPSSVANGIQIKLSATFSGAGSTPTITYQGDIVPARP